MGRYIKTSLRLRSPVGAPRLYCGLILFLAVVVGCNTQPRTILTDLPRHSAVDSFPLHPDTGIPATLQHEHAADPVVGAPPEWTPAVNERPWQWIVLHHSATDGGSAAIFDRAHRERGWDELGYHFVITNGRGGADGLVEVGGRWTKQKWGAHCGGTPNNAYNNYGIGICLVGNSSRKLPSARQLASLKKLLLFLMDRYGISPSCVIGHRDAPDTSTECPGDAMHRYINEALRPELQKDGSR
ncbi:MAG: peptidoglycan recognition family protein [Planctomycetota bacterium]|nr:peptidoglycan recognition family protein [Planctomycetota bacterium]